MEMYDLSVLVFKKKLSVLFEILQKTSHQLYEKGVEQDIILTASLAPDMWNFTKQVQTSTDFMKNGSARLAGIELQRFPDSEASLEALQTRIIKTISFLNEIKPDQINGSENKVINIKIIDEEYEFLGSDFLTTFVIPNVYFHISVAYGILRANNVSVGKRDYLGNQMINFLVR